MWGFFASGTAFAAGVYFVAGLLVACGTVLIKFSLPLTHFRFPGDVYTRMGDISLVTFLSRSSLTSKTLSALKDSFDVTHL